MPRARKPAPGQRGLFTQTSEWTPPSVSDLPSWAEAKRVGIDIETRDPSLKQLGPGVRRGAYIVGVSVAIEDGPGFYLPIRHQGGDNLDENAVLNYLHDQGKVFPGEVVGAHLAYDLDYLWEESVSFPKAKFHRDVLVADALINELHDRYNLDSVAQRWDLPGKKEELLNEYALNENLDPKKDLWRFPARFVGAYGDWDARLPLLILRRQEQAIEEQDLQRVFDLESKVTLALLRMTRRGVRIDLDKLGRIEQWAAQGEREALAEVHRLTGVQIGFGNVWQPEALAPALRAIGLEPPLTAKGKPSITAELLDGADHPVADLILRARKVNKLRTTFAASVREHLVGERLHCGFNQLATTEEDEDGTKGGRFGRISCEHPNLQQQPARDDFAQEWRSIYLPEPGQIWDCNDFSQQEPRMLTHYAEIAGVKGGREAAQRYRDDPDLDNHEMMKQITGLERTYAKQIFLGLCYGMGGPKLARKLGLDTRWQVTAGPWKARKTLYAASYVEALDMREELLEYGNVRIFEVAGERAQEILDIFNERAPYVKGMAEEAQQRAAKRGYVFTLSGRRCRFPQLEDGTYDWAHKALNRIIQGGSADQTKAAMVAVDEAGYYLMLQVHDELNSSISSPQQGKDIAQLMIEACPLNVPTKVDVELGANWGYLEKLK